MAYRAESASHTDLPRRHEPGRAPVLLWGWVLESPVIQGRPESRNGDK